jgi:taurine dioxygenase
MTVDSVIESEVALDVRRVAGALGAEVRGIDLAAPISPAQHETIRALLNEHLVLFFPDQHLNPDQHRAYAAIWGEMEIHRYIAKVDDDHPEIVVLRSETGGIADEWHTDCTFEARPPIMSILNMVTSPEVGGDTMWSNQYAVYEALSQPMKDLLDGLTAIHTAAIYGHPEQKAEHPAVRVHPETGRRCLYFSGQFLARYPQLSYGESEALRTYLKSFAAEPRFTVRHHWSEGTIAMWDNRCTQHSVTNDFEGARTINRVTILGDLPQGSEPRWAHVAQSQMSARAAGERIP